MKILCVFGTRPEAIKFAPVVKALRVDGTISTIVCTTYQHREMLDQVLSAFDIRSDLSLDVMRPDQSLFDSTARILSGLSGLLREIKPNMVLVQGDATSAFAAALSAYYARISVGHIEAGLRTWSKYAPYPEELNRRAIAVFADAHFAPTASARDNLLRENVKGEQIWVTGNTGIDALHMAMARMDHDTDLLKRLEDKFAFLDATKKMILVTSHRRESFGKPFEQICTAIREIAKLRDDVQLVYPVHLNPNVQETLRKVFGNVPGLRDHNDWSLASESFGGLHLLPPIDYLALVYLLRRAFMVITDSGGIQEEAPTIGKPVLVTRDVTERPEGITAGVAELVGTSSPRIVHSVKKLLDEPSEYSRMARAIPLYGDGHAAQRIVEILREISSQTTA